MHTHTHTQINVNLKLARVQGSPMMHKVNIFTAWSTCGSLHQHTKSSFFSLLASTQSTDLVSMVYSCIGAEIEDSDGSSTSDRATADAERSTAVSEAPADTRSNGHAAPLKQQTDRQADSCRQERIVPLADTQPELEEDGHAGAGMRPEPPPQSSKPSLAVMRQRHLQESLGNAPRSPLFQSASARFSSKL